MKISKRLKAIADMIDTNRVIDVGCDHALLDIYLTKVKRKKCIGTDISKNVIENAKINVKRYNLEHQIKLVLTDGITNIPVQNDDTIVLAGMGTNTILHILKKFKKNNPIIISSHNEIPKLRKKMIHKNYRITDERVVFEKKQCYIIIKFEKGKEKYHFDDYLIGPYAKKDIKYLKTLEEKYTKINKQIPKKYWFKKIKIWTIKNKIKKLINSF